MKKTKILFLCTGNSCRSQMAEGWTRHLRSDVVDARSAGTAPHGVDPRAVRAMAEVGVDISGQRSKDVLELMDETFDYVVTLCGRARESCPAFPGAARVLHVGFDDPAAAGSDEEVLAAFRTVRDQIRAWVETLPESLEHQGE